MKLLMVFLALGALLLAGCSGSSGGAVPKQDGQGRYEVHLTAANRFTPMEANIPVNSTVIWLNDGGVHDVTPHDESADWESPRNLKSGQTYEHKFTEPGDYDYHCELHASQGMKGTIHVG